MKTACRGLVTSTAAPSSAAYPFAAVVRYAVDKYVRSGLIRDQDRGDVEQEAHFKLFRFTGHYDPATLRISSLAETAVRWAALNLVKARRAARTLTRLDESVLDVPAEPAPPIQMNRDLARVVSELTPSRQRICAGLAAGESVTEIAHALGLCRQTVHENIQTMRQIFTAAGLGAYLGHTSEVAK